MPGPGSAVASSGRPRSQASGTPSAMDRPRSRRRGPRARDRGRPAARHESLVDGARELVLVLPAPGRRRASDEVEQLIGSVEAEGVRLNGSWRFTYHASPKRQIACAAPAGQSWSTPGARQGRSTSSCSYGSSSRTAGGGTARRRGSRARAARRCRRRRSRSRRGSRGRRAYDGRRSDVRARTARPRGVSVGSGRRWPNPRCSRFPRRMPSRGRASRLARRSDLQRAGQRRRALPAHDRDARVRRPAVRAHLRRRRLDRRDVREARAAARRRPARACRALQAQLRPASRDARRARAGARRDPRDDGRRPAERTRGHSEARRGRRGRLRRRERPARVAARLVGADAAEPDDQRHAPALHARRHLRLRLRVQRVPPLAVEPMLGRSASRSSRRR